MIGVMGAIILTALLGDQKNPQMKARDGLSRVLGVSQGTHVQFHVMFVSEEQDKQGLHALEDLDGWMVPILNYGFEIRGTYVEPGFVWTAVTVHLDLPESGQLPKVVRGIENPGEWIYDHIVDMFDNQGDKQYSGVILVLGWSGQGHDKIPGLGAGREMKRLLGLIKHPSVLIPNLSAWTYEELREEAEYNSETNELFHDRWDRALATGTPQ